MTNLKTEEILEGVFEGESEEIETKEETEGVSEEETKEEAEAETEETETEAEPPAAKDKKLVPIEVVHDERRKVKSLKEELAEYKAKYDQDEDAPDPAEDPEGYKAHVRAKVATEMHQEKIDNSMSKMIDSHPDYREKEKTFMFLSAHDNSLIEEMNNHPDPARFAYDKAETYMKEQREKIAAEIEASAKSDTVAEEKEPSESEIRNAAAVSVPDLTTATAVGSNTEPAERDNQDDLGSVFDE